MPTPSGHKVISARVPYADTIVLGRASKLAIELVRDGVPVIPDDLEKVQVIDRGGAVKFESTTLAIAGGVVSVEVPAADSTDWNIGELYQTRWFLQVDGETDARVFRRPAVVARFVLAPPISDRDLEDGNYPDLTDQLAGFGLTGDNGEATLQPYIEEAWNVVLRKLFKVNRWPDLIFSVEDLVEPVREEAWSRIFRFLFQKAGAGSKFETLWTEHRQNAKSEWSSLSARFDEDGDGLPDSEERDAMAGAVHLNAAPRRRLSRRW